MLVSRGGATVRRRAVLGALALGAVVLSGCQANPEPPPIDTASSSPSPSPSPTDAAPTLPAEAQGTSEKAAKAFVRHYIDLVNFAMRTGDTSELASLSNEECSTCRAIVARIEEVYENGGRLEGHGWRVRTLTYLATGGKRTALVAAGIRISPQMAYVASDSAASHSPASRGNLDFSLSRTPSGWQVTGLEATQ